jgi:type I restriction enzyme S subunit
MVGMGDLFGHPWIKGHEMERVPVTATELERAMLEPGDLLFARRSVKLAGAGVCSIYWGSDESTTFESSLIRVRLDQSIADPLFFFYYFRSQPGRQRIETIVEQTAVAGIKASSLGRLSISVPLVEEQKRVAQVLRSLDEKIDNNRRIARTLEEIATALFKARFVDFVEQGELVESEIGPIPRGWKIQEVGEVLQVVGGGTPSTKERMYWDNGTHCWATPKDLSGLNEPIILETARHITDAGVDRISSGLLPPWTVLMSSRAPVGYTAISLVPVAVNQGFIAVPPSDHVPSEYTLLWMRANMGRIKANAGGSTFAEISKRAFRPIPMLLPPTEELDSFKKSTEPLISQIAACVRENVLLAEIRGVLLPRLISGQVHVQSDAEVIPEAA